MKVLLIGANGQVGFALWRCLQFTQEVIPTTRRGGDVHGMNTLNLDLTDLKSLEKKLKNIEPDVIINAAAYTQVDRAESDEGEAWKVNAEVPAVLAAHAAASDALLMHYSTDYVFSGDRDMPWKEIDETAPKSVYGQTKLEGEQAIIERGCRHMIFRTAWVYSAGGHNFLRTMLRLAREKDELSVVNDQSGSPTWSETIALATMLALHKPMNGLFHLTASGQTTWYGFARRIFSHAQRIGLIEQSPRVIPISTEEFPTAASRPKNSVLDCDKFEFNYGLRLPHWQNALHLCMQTMNTETP